MSCLFPEPPLSPPEPEAYKCPVCGEEAETYYINYLGEVIGCDNCIVEKYADDYWRDRMEDLEARQYDYEERSDGK